MSQAYDPNLDCFRIDREGDPFALTNISIYSETTIKVLQAKLLMEFLKKGKPFGLDIVATEKCIELKTENLKHFDRVNLASILLQLAEEFHSASLNRTASLL